MRHIKCHILFVLVFIQLCSKAQINTELKHQLDSVGVLDQKYRAIFSVLTTKEKVDSVAKIYNLDPAQVVNHFAKMQTEIDSSNLHFIEAVINQYGYPGVTLVGPETSEVAWYILQHSDKIGQYIEIVKRAGKKGELSGRHVAMMEDRYLMYQKKEQVYGTQGTFAKFKDGSMQLIIFPIKNPKHVNKKRRKAGFDTTIEEYAKKLNISYRVVRLEDIIQ